MDEQLLKNRLQDLIDRKWENAAYKKDFERLLNGGMVRKELDGPAMLQKREEILDRVQRRAEEYEHLSHSCSKSSALAIMEEFGLGDPVIVKALSPFPGFGMTGGICGAVTGGLIGMGLFFGSDDIADYAGTGNTMTAARDFIPRFKERLGSIFCPEIQEKAIFGRYMDPRASEENFKAFVEAKGYEKCALVAGTGARLAAEIIIDSFKS